MARTLDPAKKSPEWRTRAERPLLTMRQAAWFCAGWNSLDLGAPPWSFALWPIQDSPIDIVLRQNNSSGKFDWRWVQLKEVVPDEIDPPHSLQIQLDKLQNKFSSALGITIGIYINRDATTDLSKLRLPKLGSNSIWLFGHHGEPPFDSFLVGDLLKHPLKSYYFNFPRAGCRKRVSGRARWGFRTTGGH